MVDIFPYIFYHGTSRKHIGNVILFVTQIAVDDLVNKPLCHIKFITTKIRRKECTLNTSNLVEIGILYVKNLKFTNRNVDETFIFEVIKQKSNLLIET